MSRVPLRTVLYVDDEPDIREIVALSLGLIDNLEVETCDSGQQALRLIPTFKPNLILLDVMMPGMDGPEILRRLRQDRVLNAIPVIFLTAKTMQKELAYFMALGAAGVIAKPFEPMQLGERVVAIWEQLIG